MCLRGNMGALYFHSVPRYPEHVEEMRNQVVHDLPINHESSEHVDIPHVDELMPLLDASPEHNDEKYVYLSGTKAKT